MSRNARLVAAVLLGATLGLGLVGAVIGPRGDVHRAERTRAAASLAPVTAPTKSPLASVSAATATAKHTALRPVAVRPAPTKRAATAVRSAARTARNPRTVAKPVVVPIAHVRAVTETPHQRGQRLLASLHYDWKRLGYRIVFLPEKRGYLGFTDGKVKLVTIYVRTRESDLVLAHSIAHELGHVLDFTHGTPAKRAAYLSLRGINPTTAWFGCSGCTDYATPAGDWAEVFAYWLAGPGDFRSQMGQAPNKAQVAAISQLYAY